MGLEDYLQEISDEAAPLRYSQLLQLSGLSSDSAQEFKVTWTSVPQPRKREIIGRLVELCEDNLELDFSSVLRVCLDDADVDVRAKAVRGLWESEDRSLIRPLIGMLRDDPEPEVRALAASALGKFAELAQDGKLLSKDGTRIQGALMAALGREGEDLEVMRRTIEAVAHFDSPERDKIIQAAYENGDPRLLQSSIYAMGRSSSREWLPRVIEETDHESPAIRYEAAIACGHLGDESVVPHLTTLTQDEDHQVKLAAAQALGEVGGPLAKRALLSCLDMGDKSLELAAREALSNIEFDEDPLSLKFDA